MAEKPRLVLLEPFRSAEALAALKARFSVRQTRGLAGLKGRHPGVEVLFARLKYRVDGPLLDRFPSLRFVATPATGLVHLDLAACAARGVKVVSLKDETAFLTGLTATAELAWGHVLSFHRRILPATAGVNRGVWDRDLFIGNEVKGKTLGVVGLGRLGSMVARYGTAFQMRVLYSDPRRVDLPYAKRVTLDRLLAESDVVTLHVHVSPRTEGMIGEREFRLMRRKPLFVNTSRGELVDEAALLRALRSGRVKGACLDVLRGEHWNTVAEKKRWLTGNKLLAYARRHANLQITPHVGGLTREGIERAEKYTVDKLVRVYGRA